MKRVVILLIVCICLNAQVHKSRVAVNQTNSVNRITSDRVDTAAKLEFYPTVGYQGLLKDANGVAISDGNYELTFSIYDNESSETGIWTETQKIEIKSGIVSCHIGSVEKLNLPFDKQYWLSVSVEDEELPRTLMSGTPYSLHARRIAEDAIVAGKNISVSKSEDGQIRISGSGDMKDANGEIYNLYDASTGGGIRMSTCNTAVGDSAVALGATSTASGDYSFAVGYQPVASGYSSVALGEKALSSGTNTVAIGYGATANNWMSVAIGNNSEANRQHTIAIGYEAKTDPGNGYGHSYAIGSYIDNKFRNSIILGIHKPNLFVSEYLVGIRCDSTITQSLLDSSYTGLYVNDKIVAKELELKTNIWADYVFKDGYDLKSLSEVEQHIKANGHLPGIITEKEAHTKGVNVGDIQVKLLEKIEELTLYVIEQDKQIKELHAKLK